LLAGASVALFGYTPLLVATFAALLLAMLITIFRIREPRDHSAS
jgi:hypothetical protein